MFEAVLREVLMSLNITLIVLEIEVPRVFADDLDIVPAESRKPIARDFAQRGREVDQVYCGEELGHLNELGHGLNIPSRAPAHLSDISHVIEMFCW